MVVTFSGITRPRPATRHYTCTVKGREKSRIAHHLPKHKTEIQVFSLMGFSCQKPRMLWSVYWQCKLYNKKPWFFGFWFLQCKWHMDKIIYCPPFKGKIWQKSNISQASSHMEWPCKRSGHWGVKYWPLKTLGPPMDPAIHHLTSTRYDR